MITTWKREYLGVAQLVARYLGVVEAVGSSPAIRTTVNPYKRFVYAGLLLFFALFHAINYIQKQGAR